jgi:NAD(P)-dependent dehydrogenase (short-subunit alcohol dehydrogenase family)
MAQELAGKVAIITGGVAGIGRAIVDLYLAEGARVVIADVQQERGDALAAELGANARYQQADVSKADQVEALVARAVAEFGRLDIIVNNAGITDPDRGPLDDATFAGFRRVMDVNLLGVMLCSQYAARQMIKQGDGGSIVNISSSSSLLPGHGVWTYRATKAGVNNFTASIAIDLGPELIRVNAVSPANIPSEMGVYARGGTGVTQEQSEEISRRILDIRMKRHPLKRQSYGKDIAQACVFLGSDRSAQVTGIVLPVDAGSTCGDPQSLIAEITEAREAALR